MAITNTRNDSGIETVWDGTGPSQDLSGREMVGSVTFSGAAAGITPEVQIGGEWKALSAEITADTTFTIFGGPTLRDYRFRFNCTSYTSGAPQANWDVG